MALALNAPRWAFPVLSLLPAWRSLAEFLSLEANRYMVGFFEVGRVLCLVKAGKELLRSREVKINSEEKQETADLCRSNGVVCMLRGQFWY